MRWRRPHEEEKEETVLANRVLQIVVGIASIIVIPLMFITTLVLGALVTVTFGLLLLPISLIWMLLAFPMIGASWLTSKVRWLRTPIGLLGLPWAFIANTFVTLIPSMGEVESRAAKLMLTEAWPYSWEFWRFQTSDLSLYDLLPLPLVLDRISGRDPLRKRTVERIRSGESLDP